MAIHLTADDGKISLNAHAAEKGAAIREKYGPRIGWNELSRILEDRACVRYPCTIKFDAGPLHHGEVAHPVPNGDRPEDGFTICVHPLFMIRLDQVPHLVLYQLVLVNYGEFASPEDAETLGSSALGISREEYYRMLCDLADEVA